LNRLLSKFWIFGDNMFLCGFANGNNNGSRISLRRAGRMDISPDPRVYLSWRVI